MQRNSRLALFVALSLILGRPSYAIPPSMDEDKSITGEINIEDVGPRKDSFSATQDKAIDYFDSLQETIDSVAHGQSVESIGELSDGMLSYLNAAYLYCSVNLGKCPMILDAILEIDLINSRSKRVAACPNMTRFWKGWVQGDMENRHKYMVKTGFLKVTSEFNSKERPRYLKCQDTIAEVIGDNRSDASFYAERYGSESSYNLAAAKVAKLLRDIKKEVPNVFVAVGARPAIDASASSGSGSSGTQSNSGARRAR
ncbi:MAG: hypothetical protein K1X79_05505 [Oligoflexia bacterium]|nr:hypothetical protein [Oligoflexia bacterium]